MGKRLERILELLTLIIACCALLFGENLYFAVTGHTVVQDVRRFLSIQSGATEVPIGSTVTNVPVAPSQILQPTPGVLIEEIVFAVYGQPRPPMPTPATIGQVIFAHGDIDNSGTCHVKEFGPGEAVEGLGNGTFRLIRITGTPDQIGAAEREIQQAAANDAHGSCPSQ